jgi:hypothetical protein
LQRNNNTGKEAEMSNTSQADRDAQWGNDRLKVHFLAMEILRQHSGPSLMTMAEAVTQAKKELGR